MAIKIINRNKSN